MLSQLSHVVCTRSTTKKAVIYTAVAGHLLNVQGQSTSLLEYLLGKLSGHIGTMEGSTDERRCLLQIKGG